MTPTVAVRNWRLRLRARRALERLLRPLEGRARHQGFFAALHEIGLRGMNYGHAAAVSDTGELAVLRAVADLPRGSAAPLFVDVGANVGDYAHLVLQTLGTCRLICIEPSTPARQILRERFATAGNVEVMGVAVGAEAGRADLYGDVPGSSKGALSPRTLPETVSPMRVMESVPVDTLDALAEAGGWSTVRLLKLDVEGWELPALRGAEKLLADGRVEVVQFEFGGTAVDSRFYLRDFYDVLATRFDLFRVVRDGLHPMGPWDERAEIFVMANYVAVRRDLVKAVLASLREGEPS